MPGIGRTVGLCFYCGKYTEERFNVGWRVQRAPMCGYPHAKMWAKRQGIATAAVQRVPTGK